MIHRIYATKILLLSYLLNYFETIELMDRVVVDIKLFAIKIQGIRKGMGKSLPIGSSQLL